MIGDKKVQIKISVNSKDAKKKVKGISHDVDKMAKIARQFSKDWKVSFSQAWKSVTKLEQQVSVKTQKTSHDVDKMAKTARQFSKNWGVSFNQAFKHVSKLNKEITKSKGKIDTSLMTIGQRAKKFSKAWGTSTNEALQYQKNLVKEVKHGGISMTKSTKDMSEKMGYDLTFIAWHFRYLGNILQQTTQRAIMYIKSWIDTAVQLEESFFSIRAAAALWGREAEDATEIARKLAETGLVGIIDASANVRNLMVAGMGVPEMEKLLYRYIDVASLSTSGVKDLSKSMETLTGSILKGTLLLASDRTARMLWNQTNDYLNKTLDKTIKELTEEERALAILATIEREWAGTTGLHRAEMEMMSATLGRITVAWEYLQSTLAQTFRPILETVADLFTKWGKRVENLINVFGPLFAIFVSVNIALMAFIAALSFLFGILLSVYKIQKGLTKVVAEFATTTGVASIGVGTLSVSLRALNFVIKRIIPILFIVDAAIMAITWATMRSTGALGKQEEAMKKITDQLEGMKDAYKETGERVEELEQKIEELSETIKEATEEYEISLARLVRKQSQSLEDSFNRVVRAREKMDHALKGLTENYEESTENERIAHERRTADIMEDLERERSKGLWANQMTIKDLEKRLKRENEDYARSNKQKEKGFKESKKTILTTFKEELEAAVKSISGIIELWQKHHEEVKLGKSLIDKIPDAFEELLKSFLKTTSKQIEELGKLQEEYKKLKETIKEAEEPTVNYFRIANLFIEQQKRLLLTNIGIIEKGTIGLNENANILKINADKLKEIEKREEKLEQGWRFPMAPEEKPLTWNELPEYKKKEYRGELHGTGIKGLFNKISDWFSGLNLQFGGIVPGPVGQPIPIMAHGGERIVPSRETDGGENITINFNNAVVRESADLDKIAKAVSNILGQRTKWSAMGA